MNPGNVVPYGGLVHRASINGGAEMYERALFSSGVGAGVARTLGAEAAVVAIAIAASPEGRAKIRKGLVAARQRGDQIVSDVKWRLGPRDVLATRERCCRLNDVDRG